MCLNNVKKRLYVAGGRPDTRKLVLGNNMGEFDKLFRIIVWCVVFLAFYCIDHLISKSPLPLTLDKFIAVSGDNGNNQSDSVLKICDKLKKVCTLASWVIYMPKKGSPDLYAKLARSKQPEKIYSLSFMTSSGQSDSNHVRCEI